MSQLDDLLKGMSSGQGGGLGGLAGGGQSGGGGMAALLPVLAPLIAQLIAGGGLQKLLAGFQEKGMGDKAASWVGPGANEEISPSELRQALGDDTVKQAASRAGVSEDEAASGLAALLPQIVDTITPQGQVPDQAEVDKAAARLEEVGRS